MKMLYPLQPRGRWILLCLFFLALSSQARSFRDTSSITLHVVDQPLETIFKLIEKQTGLTFFYGGSIIEGTTRMSINVDRASLSDVLNILLKGKNATWSIINNGIVLRKVEPTNTPSQSSFADSIPLINVKGIVVNKSGAPIQGATVSIKGQTRGQGTSNEGKFEFVNVPANATLIFSSIGFDPQQVRIGNRSELRIMLDSAIREIEAVEVVSTGYQSIPKERATGSFTLLGKEILERTPSTNILDRIRYVANGLRYDASGMGNTNYIIRGFSTINSNTNPLVVVDGFPYEESAGKVFIEALNPNDVESITILKDAAAASIWGARSGNGVIVITTKKGKFNSTPEVNFSSNLTLTERPDLGALSVISSPDAIFFEQALFNSGYYRHYDTNYPTVGLFPIVSPAIEAMLAGKKGKWSVQQVDSALSKYSQHSIMNDIDRYLLRDGFFQQYNINVRGGDARANYYASIGYDKNRETEVGKWKERFTVNLSSDFKLSKHVEAKLFMNFAQTTAQSSKLNYSSLLPAGSSVIAPYLNLKDENGNAAIIPHPSAGVRAAYLDTIKALGLVDWRYRPLDELNTGRINNKDLSIRVGGEFRYNIYKALNFTVSGQYNRVSSTTRDESDVESYLIRNLINRFVYTDAGGKQHYPYPLGGRLARTNRDLAVWNIRGQLNFNETWEEHAVSAIGGWETSESSTDQNTSELLGYDKQTGTFVSNIDYQTAYLLRPLGRGIVANSAATEGYLNRFRSFFANASYTFRDRYTVSASGRTDETNLIGLDASLRRTPLWSVGASWNIANEGWLSSKIGRLSLRTTYGWNGNINSSVSALPIVLHVPNSGSLYTGFPYAVLTSPPNPNLAWEKVKTLNIGLDYGFWGNRIFGSVEWYRKNGQDLLGTIQSDPTRGISTYQGNYASIISKGWDIALNAVLFKRKDMRALATFNFSYNTDEITDYALQSEDNLKNPLNYLGGKTILIKGEPLYQMYAYKWAGLDPKTGDPRGYLADTVARFLDVMNSGDLTSIQKIGSSVPKYFGNFLGSFSKGNLSISFNLTYSLGYYFINRAISYSSLIQYGSTISEFSQRWNEPGDEAVTDVPSMVLSFNPQRDDFYALSSVKVERGDHVRLQDIRLAYSLPAILKKCNITLVGTATNLGVIWKATKLDVDPMSPGNVGVPRQYTISVNARF